MDGILNSYAGLPEELLSAAAQALSASAARTSCDTDTSGCNADEWDCSTDSASCSRDGVCSDTCRSDGVCSDTCSSDGVCSDTPSVTKPTQSGSISVVSVTESSITVRMTSIPRADHYEVAYMAEGGSSPTYETSYSLTYTITGLQPGTTYLINYRGGNSAGYGPYTSARASGTTSSAAKPTQSGTITVTGVTKNSITVRMTSIPLADFYEVAYMAEGAASPTYATSYSLTYTITGLQPGTTYLINYRGGNSAGYGPYTASRASATTLSGFDWTYAGLDSGGSPVAGSAKQEGLGIYVTAAEWNRLAGLVSSVTGKTVRTVSPGELISAAAVNTAASALGVNTVSSGDAISASFFNRLRSAYNALL